MAAEHVDLGPARDEVGLLVVLPGRGYHPDKPLLAVATQAAVDLGWRVRQVWWKAPEQVDTAWAGAQLADAVSGYDGPVRLLAKSLASLAAHEAARAAYGSCWLTPLLGRDDVVEGIAANRATQLLVGGTADEAWDSATAQRLAGRGVEVLELPGADHSLNARGRNATASAHAEFIRVFGRWLAERE
ncbi:hypothetical protein P5P86_03350 [Nocardioides sp. BP30]|uniref:hypothetical protein n=1 Tax=Nocardioides sp. BP30 TaxID=3036374 RepID=UPI0024692336|nr:hypothetical protein [Nocardioides sp. BP30]WGL52865.1 hypothetical protein P5P86_03350 [Nocardioides sp. BP30]